jgi:bacterioferritin-associated ferredoxin
MFACICRRVTEADVCQAGVRGFVASDALVMALGLDEEGCCGRCLARVDEFVELALRGAAAQQPVRAAEDARLVIAR